ncbi:NAD(P)/FAD-dependent oxidoreductase [Amycolatopsis thermophila]|uniref:2-polyprenyl-6-methoxyphenol hydroxylase-like FAD-dependent oxidoreductase n=1 Tax=Amycolatopsis thermophila TaxID=206084 RepID=A0ABU0ESS8_9PSEU|nr:FAD-dependent monooxygenase [Amycolatopsis thermophila]MDQ0377872.1 2-polyprenyl-6-methoxyphenol hydroxylase-like FAD-dependent oxidoreductase [Amycolatopsis thermophila]
MRTAVVGGGPAGLLSALMLAREGHDVVVFDQDNLAPVPDVETAAEEAYRPGAPQAVQPHIVMSRCRLVLAERLPDVLADLIRAGAIEAPLADRRPPTLRQLPARPGDERLATIMARRSTFDLVLRRAAARQDGLEIRAERVSGLSAQAGPVPHICGVRTAQGEIPADLVVDASGRRSPIDKWLQHHGARPAEKLSAECGVTYYGRHYRLRTQAALPGPLNTRVVTAFDEFTAVLFCSDHGAVQTAVAPLTADHRYRPLAHEDAYDAVLRALPTHAPWMPYLDPISPVRQMVAPHNTLRRLVVDGAPLATGLLTVGDAVSTTNPTFGRGLSLAAWGAADLTDVLAEHPDDAIAQTLALDARIAEHVAPYYQDQARTDLARLAALRHVVLGTPPAPRASGDHPVGFAQLRAAAAVDATAFRAYWELMGMLRSPSDIYSDPHILTAISKSESDIQPPTPDSAMLQAALRRPSSAHSRSARQPPATLPARTDGKVR